MLWARNMRGISKKDQFRLLARRNRVSESYLRGTPQHIIAQQEKVDPGQITRDLAVLRAQWLRSSICNLDAHKSRELARLEVIEREAWAAWERSKADRERTVREKVESAPLASPTSDTKRKPARGANRAKVSVHTEGRLPENEYLRTLLACIAKRCDILGINAPTKVAPTDPSGEKPYVGDADPRNVPGFLAQLDAWAAGRDLAQRQGADAALGAVPEKPADNGVGHGGR
jgi:hypothetical protein